LHVQRSGDIGSPLLVGSTSASRSASKLASMSTNRLRPPPGARTRLGASAAVNGGVAALLLALALTADSISAKPAYTVVRDSPATLATTLTPPRPRLRASAAAHNRSVASFSRWDSALNFASTSGV
jgi:hypothetical protein